MKRVYLDHNATTPLRPEAREALLDALDAVRGNPSSVHAAGRAARQLLDDARQRVARALGVEEDEVVFTSGATESNELSLWGALVGGAGPGLVTTTIEHSSVLGPAGEIERSGRPVERVAVDRLGLVDAGDVVRAAERCGAGLVSVMAANNEVGTLAPLEAIGRGLAGLESRPLLHTDAVQALGRVPLELGAWGVHLASFSAHKLGGPVGVGVLVRRRGVALAPRWAGAAQESGLRPGTENVVGIVAAARAIELAVLERAAFATSLRELGTTLWTELASAVPRARLLGPAVDDPRRLPGTLNVLLPDVEGKVLVTRLDLQGLEASAGSACASGSLEPSHVLRAMGLDDDDARAGLRLSLGRTTSWADVRQAVDILRTTVAAGAAKRGARTGL